MKIRIKFRKYGALKFVGHLDMMRYFQKALKRAGIDMKYSEGFNPHMIMSFAAPLGVGITSDGEYFDIEVLSTKSTAESLKVLNEAMVEGVEVTSYVSLPEYREKIHVFRLRQQTMTSSIKKVMKFQDRLQNLRRSIGISTKNSPKS